MQETTTPTRQALAVEGRSAKMKVTGKLAEAIGFMVFDGFPRAEAANLAGLADHSLREALRKPHVRAYYAEQFNVLRTSAKARGYQRLIEISEQSTNLNAAVIAAKVLVGDDEASKQTTAVMANVGFSIVVNGPDAGRSQTGGNRDQGRDQARVIDAKPVENGDN